MKGRQNWSRWALGLGLTLGLWASPSAWAAPKRPAPAQAAPKAPAALDPNQIIKFPDPNFKKKLILLELDLNDDGEIQVSEAQKVTKLYVDECGIESLKGIKYFTNLDEFGCYKNQIKTLDVEGMPKLRLLYCFANRIDSLNVRNLPKLETLYFSWNAVSEVDCSDSPNLEQFQASDNRLTRLDLRRFRKLKKLVVKENPLTELSCSGLSQLEFVEASKSQLTRFDPSGLTSLKTLNLNDNRLQGALDMRESTKLEKLFLSDNPLTGLDIRNLPALTDLVCFNTLIRTINFSGTTSLKEIYWSFGSRK